LFSVWIFSDLRLLLLETRSKTKIRKPAGIANIGIIPNPTGTQDTLLKAASKIIRTEITVIPTQAIKAKPKTDSSLDVLECAAVCLFLAILLGYLQT